MNPNGLSPLAQTLTNMQQERLGTFSSMQSQCLLTHHAPVLVLVSMLLLQLLAYSGGMRTNSATPPYYGTVYSRMTTLGLLWQFMMLLRITLHKLVVINA